MVRQRWEAAGPIEVIKTRAAEVERRLAQQPVYVEVKLAMDTHATLAAEHSPRGPEPTLPPAPVAFHYKQSDSFVELLHRLGVTLLVSTYQANKLLAVRASGQGLSTLVRTFDKPMGLAVDRSRLVIGTRKEVWFLRN